MEKSLKIILKHARGLVYVVVHLNLVKEKGKGQWKQFLEIFHNKHWLTDIGSEDQLRAKYNDLKTRSKSKYFKQYVPPPLTPPKGTDEEKLRKEAEHAEKCAWEQRTLEAGRKLIEEIESKEERLGSEDKDDEEAIRETMEHRGQDRCDDERTE